MAQVRYDGIIELDTVSYDLGPVREADGRVEGSFHLTNISDSPVTVYNISVTCSCTEPIWSKDPIPPGESIDIKVIFDPFSQFGNIDKPLHLYVTGVGKPVELHLKGRIISRTIEDKYSINLGPLFVSDTIFNAGTIHPGESAIGFVNIANPLQDTLRLSFPHIPDGLEVIEMPKYIVGRGEEQLVLSVVADSLGLGYNSLNFTAIVNDVPSSDLRVDYSVVQDFSGLDSESVRQGPRPRVSSSTEYFTDAVYGSPCHISLRITNAGGQTLVIHSVDAVSDSDIYLPDAISSWTCEPIEPGSTGFARIIFDTTKFQAGSLASFKVCFTTNSPLRPQVSVPVKGFIEP